MRIGDVTGVVGKAAVYLWAGPNTLLGLIAALAAGRRGRLARVGGVLEVTGGGVPRLLRLLPVPGSVLAVTLGHVVLATDAETMAAVRAHERVHVRQFARWGPFFLPAYALASLVSLARRRNAYVDNVFEREAFRTGDSAAGRIGPRAGYSERMARRTHLLLSLVIVVGTSCAAGREFSPNMDSAFYPEPPRNAITFWGHACAYIDVGGFGIVTDPVFVARYATIRRRVIPTPPDAAFDQARVVLISHAHHDHLSGRTLERFPSSAQILAPAPAADYLRKRGIRARVMKPGDEYPIPGGSIIAVDAHHPGGRHSLKARSDGRAIGYIIQTEYSTIYYSGDTEYFPGLASIGTRYTPDVAILNVNPHLRSPEAIFAVADLGMPIVLPIHRGAYNTRSRRYEQQWVSELETALGPIVVPLEVGESFVLPSSREGAVGAR